MNSWTLGIMAGLATAALWTFTSLCFEAASRKMGSLALNLIRLVIAMVFFVILALLRTGLPFPGDLDGPAWLWLGLSGLVGFVLGDLFLFKAFLLIGARLSMLVYASVPPLAAVMGWVFLGESVGPWALLGMGITLVGIVAAVALRPAATAPEEAGEPAPGAPTGDAGPQDHDRIGTRARTTKRKHLAGIILAFLGSLAQAGGLVLSKFGAGGTDSFAATQVRVLAGIAGFALLVTVLGRWKAVLAPVRKPRAWAGAWGFTLVGSLIGPFLGVSLGLLATQLTTTGVASTLMALVPVMIIAPSALLFKEKVRPAELLGALAACGGVALMFL